MFVFLQVAPATIHGSPAADLKYPQECLALLARAGDAGLGWAERAQVGTYGGEPAEFHGAWRGERGRGHHVGGCPGLAPSR